jgi:serine/threonine protein kinase
MGVVYRAEHVVNKQAVVIKRLHDEHARSPDVVARFLQEARSAAAIDDPGVARVFGSARHRVRSKPTKSLSEASLLMERYAKHRHFF